jgi:hypothetical protein
VSRGAKSTLWQRLRTHRGTSRGGGNHRSSIFRLHVGSALIRQDRVLDLALRNWGTGQNASRSILKSERRHEECVSDYISDLRVVVLPISGVSSPDNDRAFVERNLIGLIAQAGSPDDPPSPQWLGRSCSNPAICASGLWNVDWIGWPTHPDFVCLFSEYLKRLAEGAPLRSEMAPLGWRNLARSHKQLQLFPHST